MPEQSFKIMREYDVSIKMKQPTITDAMAKAKSNSFTLIEFSTVFVHNVGLNTVHSKLGANSVGLFICIGRDHYHSIQIRQILFKGFC